VSVDGVQIGDTQTATVIRGTGHQEFDILGNFAAGPHTVAVNLLNGLPGNTVATERSLYVDKATIDGKAVVHAWLAEINSGSQSLGFTTNGTSGTPPPGPTTLGSGPDDLQLLMSEDAYQGDAQFTVSVDGTQVGGTQTVTALHGTGTQAFDLLGTYAAGAHDVTVNFLNDLYGGSPTTDRNLYVNGASIDGAAVAGSALTEMAGGPQSFSFTTVGAPPPADTLTLNVSEDAYGGDAQFSVTLDGKLIGGTQTATASHAAGASQAITLTGSFGAGPHTVAVTFLNDLYDAGGDRNLYLSSATFDGGTTQVNAGLYSTGNTATFTVAPAAGTTGGGTGGTTGGGNSSDPTGIVAGSPMQMLGVNLSGAEYNAGNTSAQVNTDYVYPNHAELDYYASIGMNVIRMPLAWERLQPVQGGALDPTQLGYIDDIVNYAATKGIKVDLDNHNYAYGYGNMVGSAGTPNSSLADFWSKMASHYAGNSNVIYGIMNEPHDQTATQWESAAQASINAIRATGATQEILVPGSYWTGAHSWTSSDNSSVMAGITDSGHNMAFELHQYLDADSSGTSTTVVSPTIGAERLSAATSWAQSTGNRLFLGEFGAGSDPASIAALTNELSFMQQHSDVWQGGTYWSGGPWMGSYMFNADPANGVQTAQAQTLAKYAPTH